MCSFLYQISGAKAVGPQCSRPEMPSLHIWQGSSPSKTSETEPSATFVQMVVAECLQSVFQTPSCKIRTGKCFSTCFPERRIRSQGQTVPWWYALIAFASGEPLKVRYTYLGSCSAECSQSP
jgi:hypothetical protein